MEGIAIRQPLYIHEIGGRANQEDCLYPSPDNLSPGNRIFVLCDGMGGHDSGEVASNCVCGSIGRWFENRPAEWLTEEGFAQALDKAYDDLDRFDNSGSMRKMGTTLVCAAFGPKGLLVAHIGDSRIYHIRPQTRQILYKSYDHSLVNDLIRVGEMTEEEAAKSRHRNILTRAIQPHQEERCQADVRILTDLRCGDYIYLCTDGMLENIDDRGILDIFCSQQPDSRKVEMLMENSRDNRDNHTALIIGIEGEKPGTAPGRSLSQVRAVKKPLPSRNVVSRHRITRDLTIVFIITVVVFVIMLIRKYLL